MSPVHWKVITSTFPTQVEQLYDLISALDDNTNHLQKEHNAHQNHADDGKNWTRAPLRLLVGEHVVNLGEASAHETNNANQGDGEGGEGPHNVRNAHRLGHSGGSSTAEADDDGGEHQCDNQKTPNDLAFPLTVATEIKIAVVVTVHNNIVLARNVDVKALSSEQVLLRVARLYDNPRDVLEHTGLRRVADDADQKEGEGNHGESGGNSVDGTHCWLGTKKLLTFGLTTNATAKRKRQVDLKIFSHILYALNCITLNYKAYFNSIITRVHKRFAMHKLPPRREYYTMWCSNV